MIHIDKVVVKEEELKKEIIQRIKSGKDDAVLKMFYDRMKRGLGKKIFKSVVKKIAK
jgi:hypothetical protein